MQKLVSLYLQYLRNTFGEHRFLNGDCFKLYANIKLLYPPAEAWYEPVDGHVVTKIGDSFYDITGEVSLSDKAYPLDIEPRLYEEAKTWAYTEKT